MNSFKESLIYYSVKFFGSFVRSLPVSAALAVGRAIGTLAYYFDVRHKAQAYANLKIAFGHTKSADEIKRIVKDLFRNYGQNLIELLRMPLLNQENFEEFIKIEGREHILKAREKGKGVILLPMHFGSWELASLSTAMLGCPYKMIVKPQKKYSKLDELLNSYRECSGTVVVQRGIGSREIIRGLQNNELIGMVVDQGGRDGTLVPFFGRQASMAVGAIRIALKFGVPVCFCIIIREKGPYHRFVIHPPMELENTGDTEKDVKGNLVHVTQIMERYIRQSPAEYMWFYKIWKYSPETNALILNDGRTGHLRQSQAVARVLGLALKEREMACSVETADVTFRSRLGPTLLSLASVLPNQARLAAVRGLLTRESYDRVMPIKADYVISCGSKTAALNHILARSQQAKSIAVLRPGLLDARMFDLVILPEHDRPDRLSPDDPLIFTKGAPNLISREYLEEQAALLKKRFTHLQADRGYNIGLFLGGPTKKHPMDETRVKVALNQVREAAEQLDGGILAVTSRRTPERIEKMVHRELKEDPRCRLLILAKRNNVPEAVGGVLGLSDAVVVSGDSISMISESACSGKGTIVFPSEDTQGGSPKEKHRAFVETLRDQGHVLFTDPWTIRASIGSLAKNKFKTRALNDEPVLLEGIRRIV